MQNNFQKKVVLVAGGAGFLGSHLCDRLIADGARVVCLDSLLTGSLENVAHLHDHPDFEFVQHDVIEPLDRCTGVVNQRIDEIYNLACPASPPRYQADPIHTMKTSVLGALNLLELARKHDCKIFQASTSEVYGDPLVHPQVESYWGHVNPIGIRSCYDEGKRAAETLFFDYHRRHGVKIKVARIFNTYGPRMDPSDGRVVSNFIVQHLRGEAITIYGDGSQTRSFCYVDDLIEGFVRLMACNNEAIRPVNLGNPNEFTIKQLAEEIIQSSDINYRLTYLPLPSDDPMQRRPDIGVARDLLGWTPTIELREGLRKTVAYFVAKLNLSVAPAAPMHSTSKKAS